MDKKYQSIVEDVSKNEGFNNFTVEKTKGSDKGDNYLGIISFLTVIEKNEDKKLYLVSKSAQTHEKLREAAPIAEAYIREVHLYDTIFPEFINFQKERNVEKPFTNICKVYATSTEPMNEIIIMEDLTRNDFKMWDRMQPMNLDHVELAMKTYGKWHAISMAFKTLKPTKFLELTNSIHDSIFANQTRKDMAAWSKICKELFQDMLKTVDGHEIAIEYIEKFESIFEKFILEEVPQCQLVVTHGDCWCNNFMFSYKDLDDPSKPTDIRLLDWQLAQLGSPVLDLSYFLLVNVAQPELSNIDKFLDIYYNSVSENLLDFGCDPSEVFPRSLLHQHWKQFAKYGLIVAYRVLKLALGESGEVPDLEKIVEEGKAIIKGFDIELKRDEVYKKRIVDIVTYLAENDLM